MPDKFKGHMIINGVKIPVSDWEALEPAPPTPGEVISTDLVVVQAGDPTKIGRREPTKFGKQYRAKRPERN